MRLDESGKVLETNLVFHAKRILATDAFLDSGSKESNQLTLAGRVHTLPQHDVVLYSGAINLTFTSKVDELPVERRD